jgi:ribulose 1,5-bisphosphate carboxylase large subunit-like protein
MFNELKKDKKFTSETNQEVLYFLNVTDEKARILSNHRKATEKSAICVLCVISSL